MTSSNDKRSMQSGTDDKTQGYHKGQRCEEEAHDELDIRPVTHDHPQALTEGERLGLVPPDYWKRGRE